MPNNKEDHEEFELIIENLDDPSTSKKKIIESGLSLLSKTTLTRRELSVGTIAAAMGFAGGALTERTYHVSNVFIPNKEDTQRRSDEAKLKQLLFSVDQDNNIWLNENLAKFADVYNFIFDVTPTLYLLSDEKLSRQLASYSHDHERDPSLIQLENMVEMTQQYRASRGETFSFQDLLLAYANVPYRRNPTGHNNDQDFIKTRKYIQNPRSTALQAVDLFMQTTSNFRDQYTTGILTASEYTNRFTHALLTGYQILGRSIQPQGDIKSIAVKFVGTSLGNATGIQ